MQCLNGQMDFSVMLMFVFFSFSIFASLEPISDSAHTLGVIDDAMDQLDALRGEHFIDADGKDIKLDRYDIRFDHVDFGYDTRKVLKDVSFTIPEKTSTAIVGPSGSGKTTFCSLLARFYDPQSGTFGALGHGVTDVDTGQLLPLDHGSIMDASVKAVKKGERASPGELMGDFDLTRDSGTLYANTECGIFGKLSAEDAAKIVGAALPIAKKDEVKTGKATILATVSGNETREYDIEIEKIYSPSGSTRNLLLHVTDEELLAQTGGVVQGMSGSAILQDGKIIGAVTHVLLDDPSRGYGIFIENMLSAAGLSSE